MLKDEPDDRMVPVMAASKAFTGAMQVNLNQDHIGLVSFGEKGPAKLSPVYTSINVDDSYYDPALSGWTYGNLNGNYWYWPNLYGINTNAHLAHGS